jgi:DNA-binding SARP family transcriptional activator
MLLVRAPHVVTIEELVDGIWGQRLPAHPKAAVHTLVTRLRRRLGEPGLVHTEPGGYRITPAYLDLDEFHTRVAAARRAARRADRRGEAAELRAALDLWRGPPLADVPSEELHRWAAPALAERRLAVLQRRVDADLALGRCAALVPELRELTARHPLREGFWAQLMLALHLADRRADALLAYGTARRALREELGVEPGLALRRMHVRVLAGRMSPAPPLGYRAIANE